MPPLLQLRLLGEFCLLYDGQPIHLAGSARVQALLAYLALQRAAPQPRQHLAFLFWPDVTEAQARNNLRQTLFQLRRAWPDTDRFVAADAHALGWRSGAAIEVDVWAFEAALAGADGAERSADLAAARASLEQALDLYRGELLVGCYDEWIEPERDRLRQAHRTAVLRLKGLLEAARDYAAAILQTERLLRLDPLDEDAYASLMRLHALNNDRASALRVYRECETTLHKELGVPPGPAVREAYERLLRLAALPSDHPPWSTTWPLIGRQREWARLQAAWRRTAGGQAGFALVAGEAGIGKSRLAEELLLWAGQQGIATASTRAYAAEGRLAYGPVADWLRSAPVHACLEGLPPSWLTEVARLLPELLVERPDLPQPEPLTEYWQRRRFFETLARVMLAASQPLLLLIDDLQWCDPETLEWLHYLLRFDAQARLLVLGTARAEDVLPPHPLNTLLLDLQALGRVTALTLGPLDKHETYRLAAFASGNALAASAAKQLFSETEGNPLFVVETVRATLGPGTPADVTPDPSARGQPLPPRVHGVIAARLGQLSPPAGELAGLAATIGRAFQLDVLALAAGVHETDLARGLDELWQRRIIREQGAGTYDFSHDKLREVAYTEVSPPLRRLLHRRVAQALETAHAPDLMAVSGQIAVHYEQAGLQAQAIPYYQRAATVAQRVYANAEAISLLRKGLALLRDLPASADRDALELGLQTALGAALVASQGYDSQAAMEAYSRASTLCQQLGQPASPPILRGLAIASIGRGHIRQAHGYGDQLRALAELSQDPVLEVEAYYVHGVTWFWQGDFTTSRVHLEEAIARYRPQHAHTHLALYSQDPKVVCLIRLAFDLWCLGYPEQAEQARQAALALARELSHPLTLGYTLFWSALLHNHRQDPKTTCEDAEAVIALGPEVPYWQPFAMVLRGWALAQQGDSQAGWAEVQAGLAALNAAQRELFQPYYMAVLAELHAQSGRVETGLALLAEGLAVVERKEERWCESELTRRQGELYLQLDDFGSAETALLKSLTIAQYQQAKSLELRTATHLARLWQRQERRDDARRVLGAAYGWFTEGLALPELVVARSLLAQL